MVGVAAVVRLPGRAGVARGVSAGGGRGKLVRVWVLRGGRVRIMSHPTRGRAGRRRRRRRRSPRVRPWAGTRGQRRRAVRSRRLGGGDPVRGRRRTARGWRRRMRRRRRRRGAPRKRGHRGGVGRGAERRQLLLLSLRRVLMRGGDLLLPTRHGRRRGLRDGVLLLLVVVVVVRGGGLCLVLVLLRLQPPRQRLVALERTRLVLVAALLRLQSPGEFLVGDVWGGGGFALQTLRRLGRELLLLFLALQGLFGQALGVPRRLARGFLRLRTPGVGGFVLRLFRLHLSTNLLHLGHLPFRRSLRSPAERSLPVRGGACLRGGLLRGGCALSCRLGFLRGGSLLRGAFLGLFTHRPVGSLAAVAIFRGGALVRVRLGAVRRPAVMFGRGLARGGVRRLDGVGSPLGDVAVGLHPPHSRLEAVPCARNQVRHRHHRLALDRGEHRVVALALLRQRQLPAPILG